ncbi:MAG: iron-sulfur cluster assembly accessory protein [Gammaproteobacteria bacterium]|nr:iron-sulfur cluster assembly accessory protein [Gammaproteobacteria bacterium]MCY4344903.1 iron-sulfur cluster assembly accessory protein [Gammaproteobacteria bacterium]
MSVATFNPADAAAITVTDAAVAHIARQIARSGRSCLRLGLKESGCNGYMYVLDYIDRPQADDRAFEIAQGLALHVRQSDLHLLRGTEVDLITEGLNTNLQFKNPNATAQCGCGESFSLAADDAG